MKFSGNAVGAAVWTLAVALITTYSNDYLGRKSQKEFDVAQRKQRVIVTLQGLRYPLDEVYTLWLEGEIMSAWWGAAGKINPARRDEFEKESVRFYEHSIEALAKTIDVERDMNATLAEITILFPKSPELSRKVAAIAHRKDPKILYPADNLTGDTLNVWREKTRHLLAKHLETTIDKPIEDLAVFLVQQLPES
jgi:hypothetical protein